MFSKFHHQFSAIISFVLLVFICIFVPVCQQRHQPASIHRWTLAWAQLQDSLSLLNNDWEKSNYLRKFCAGLMNVGIADERTRNYYRNLRFENFPPENFFMLQADDSLPSDCGTTSYFFIKLAQRLGYKSYQYSFGFTDSPYQRYIHSFPIIEIDFNGETRTIIQDPYLDISYLDSKQEPIDFYRFLRLIKEKKYDQLSLYSDSSYTHLIITDTALYLPRLNDSCGSLLRSALITAEGETVKKIPFKRSYQSLMRSACDPFEAGFEKALQAHQIFEPFLFAYTLRVNTMAGSGDVEAIQAHIDSLLHNTAVY